MLALLILEYHYCLHFLPSPLSFEGGEVWTAGWMVGSPLFLPLFEHLLLLHRIELGTPWLSFDVGGCLVLSGALAENNIPGFGEYKIYISLAIQYFLAGQAWGGY